MLEWKKSDRASNCYVLVHDGIRHDVWKVGDVWQWTTERQGVYISKGTESTLDNACEVALGTALTLEEKKSDD